MLQGQGFDTRIYVKKPALRTLIIRITVAWISP